MARMISRIGAVMMSAIGTWYNDDRQPDRDRRQLMDGADQRLQDIADHADWLLASHLDRLHERVGGQRDRDRRQP